MQMKCLIFEMVDNLLMLKDNFSESIYNIAETELFLWAISYLWHRYKY